MQIIQCTVDDEEYPLCLKIRRQVFIEEQGVDEAIEIDAHEKEAIYFLARIEGVPVATGRFRVKGPHVKFERVATLPSYRGQGIATRLMEAMQKVVTNKYPELTPLMHSQKEVIPFYEKLGWEVAGEPFVEAEIEHQMMVLASGFCCSKSLAL